MRRRSIRVSATLVVTGLCTAYILWKIDVGKTIDILRDARARATSSRAVAIMVVTVSPMAWRWQQLLAGRGIHDGSRWLTRAYFIVVHGRPGAADVGRRRRDADLRDDRGATPGTAGRSPGSVLLERALGGAATLAARRGRLRARDRALRRRRLPLGRAALRRRARSCSAVVLFSRRDATPARAGRCRCCAGSASSGRCAPSTRASTLPRPRRGCSLGVCVLTLVIQAVRVLAIWLTGEGGRRRPLAARRTT